MREVSVNELWTFILAILAILLGDSLNRLLPRLRASNVPPAVSGGLVLARLGAILHASRGVELHFASGNRNALLLVFFVVLGLAAKFSGLRQGGWQVGGLCVIIAVTVLAQNAAGATLARAFGEPAVLGLFVGSISFLGGHGTAAAWSQAPEAGGLSSAFELGIAAATLGLVAGGLVAGPIATRLARRTTGDPGSRPPVAAGEAPGLETTTRLVDVLSSDRWLKTLLLIAAALAIGQLLQGVAARHGVTIPAFLTAMFGGILLTNAADLLGRPVDHHLAELISTIALRLFLAMSMLGLKLWALVPFAALLSAVIVAQVVLIALIAVLLVYPLMGRDGEAAIAVGGFIGFGLGAMPVGLGTMRRLAESLGPAPRAFVVITLAASLFADTANAIGIALCFGWLE